MTSRQDRCLPEKFRRQSREGLDIDLLVRAQGKALEGMELGRQHVAWKLPGELDPELLGGRSCGLQNHEGNEHLHWIRAFALGDTDGDHLGRADALQGEHLALHLAQFDPVPADLDLSILAPQHLKASVPQAPRAITGAVDAHQSTGEFALDKARRRQLRILEVAPRQACPHETELAGRTRWKGLQIPVQNQRAHAVDRAAHGHRVAGLDLGRMAQLQDLVPGRVDARLRGSVVVEHARAEASGAPAA